MKVFFALAVGTACSISFNLFATVQPASAVPESEPNSSFASSQLLPPGTDTVNGSISPSDIDFFTFSGLDAGISFTTEITSATLDTVLGLLNDFGNIIETDDDDGAGVLSLLTGTVPASGNLNLAVTGYPDFGITGAHRQSGSYTLSLETTPVSSPLVFSDSTIGYLTDFNEFTTAPAAAINQAGFTAVQITDISTFDSNRTVYAPNVTAYVQSLQEPTPVPEPASVLGVFAVGT